MPADLDTTYRQCCDLLLSVWEDDPAVVWGYSESNGSILTIPGTITDANTQTAIYGIPIEWPNVEDNVDRNKDAQGNSVLPWARYRFQPATGRQTNIGNLGSVNRYESTGLITLEIRVPAGRGVTLANKLITLAQSAYRGKFTAGGAFFKNIRSRTVGIDGGYYRKDCLVDFQFDEVT